MAFEKINTIIHTFFLTGLAAESDPRPPLRGFDFATASLNWCIQVKGGKNVLCDKKK